MELNFFHSQKIKINSLSFLKKSQVVIYLVSFKRCFEYCIGRIESSSIRRPKNFTDFLKQNFLKLNHKIIVIAFFIVLIILKMFEQYDFSERLL